jgi:hypothetical protein
VRHATACLPARMVAAVLRALVTLLIAAFVLRAGVAGADDSAKRALLFAKALSFERRLLANKGDSVGIVVIHAASDAASAEAARRWVGAFNSLGAITVGGSPVEVTSAAYDRQRILELIRGRGIDVLIACSGVPVQEVGNLAREQSILSAADTLAGVQERLTLGVFVEGEKPRILVNMRAAELEGAKFSSKLLQLAERI